jgi:hypothetical protein
MTQNRVTTGAMTTERLQKTALEFLEETFEAHQGIYLDKGTSLFETLDAVTAEEASVRFSDSCASVAAQVRHVVFYLRVLQDHIRGKQVGKVDWRKIWENDRPVSWEEWQAVVGELREEYASVRRLASEPQTWEREDALGGVMAMVAHTAYHLASIRLSLSVMRTRAEQRYL